MAQLECRIPISDVPHFHNKVRVLEASIRQFYPSVIVRTSVDVDLNAWKGTDSPYLATVLDKFKPPFQGTHVLMLDADVICMRNFDELFHIDAIQGVMAHVPPMGIMDWQLLFAGFGLSPPQFNHDYSGWGVMVNDPWARKGPVYFNSGVVFGPAHLFERLYEPYMAAIDYMRKSMRSTYWFDQTGLALGLEKANIPTLVLPLKYNFPNQKEFDDAHPDELKEARFIHYLRTNIIDRDEIMDNREAMQDFVSRTDLAESNERVRKRVEYLLPKLG